MQPIASHAQAWFNSTPQNASIWGLGGRDQCSRCDLKESPSFCRKYWTLSSLANDVFPPTACVPDWTKSWCWSLRFCKGKVGKVFEFACEWFGNSDFSPIWLLQEKTLWMVAICRDENFPHLLFIDCIRTNILTSEEFLEIWKPHRFVWSVKPFVPLLSMKTML